eukprot:2949788-Rhodomonas_salina.3
MEMLREMGELDAHAGQGEEMQKMKARTKELERRPQNLRAKLASQRAATDLVDAWSRSPDGKDGEGKWAAVRPANPTPSVPRTENPKPKISKP